MELIAYGNLGTHELLSAPDGGAIAWPVIPAGSTIKLGFRPIQTIGGQTTEVRRTVTGMRVAIGRLDQPPTAGGFSLYLNGTSRTVTVSGDTWTCTGHPFSAGQRVFLTTVGVIPPGSAASQVYFIVSPATNTFKLSLTAGGSAITTTGPGTGTHSVWPISAEIAYNAAAADVQTALNALPDIATYGSAAVETVSRSWMASFGAGTVEVPLRVFANRLRPISHVIIRAANIGGVWKHRIRPTQTPVAKSDTLTEEQHDPPVVTQLEAGFEADGVKKAEVQKVVFNPHYRGTYQLRFDGRRTDYLDRDDGPDEWAAALNAIAESGESWRVTLPQTQTGHIYFEGTLAGINQPLIEVYPIDGLGPDATVTLDTGGWNAAVLLDDETFDAEDQAELEFALEVDYTDPGNANGTLTFSHQSTLTIRRELITPELEVIQEIEYLKPYNPKRYLPHGAGQITVGHAGYRATFGANITTSFTHNLDTPDLLPFVWETGGDRKGLINGTDFAIEQSGNNSAEVTLLGDYDPAPGANTLTLLILAANDTSAFDDHTHTIADVDGLRAELDLLWDEVNALSALAPAAVPLVRDSSDLVEKWPAPTVHLTLPRPPGSFAPEVPTDLRSIGDADLFERYRLFPAVANTTAGNLTVPLPAVSDTLKGKVYQYHTSFTSDITLPFGDRLKPGDYAACDGRRWYRVEKLDSGKATWYPAHPHYAAPVFWARQISEKQLRSGRTLRGEFGIELRALFDTSSRDRDRRTEIAARLRLEVGYWTQTTTPGTQDTNLAAVTWQATPLAELPVLITGDATIYTIGTEISRSGSDVTYKPILFGAEEAGGTLTSATFAIRCRLCGLDTANAPIDARAVILISGCDRSEFAEAPANFGAFTFQK